MTRRSRLPVPIAGAAVACVVGALLVLGAPAAMAATFSNATSISVPDAACAGAAGQATPYPSNISVMGMTGTITDVNVTLKNVNSDYTGDLEVLLVGPSGGANSLILMSDAGQAPSGVISNVTFVFDDAAASLLPQNGELGPNNSTRTAKPTNYSEAMSDTFPAPAPSPSANTTLAGAFNGQNPNGTWSLYVIDDACGDGTDTISGGWSLDVTTAASAAPTTTDLTSSPNPSTTGQLVTFTATVTSGGNPVTTGTVTFTEGATTLAANVPVDGNGVAAFQTAALTEGNHIISAVYNGTASFATSNDSVDQRVNNATTNPSPGVYCNTGAITLPSNQATTPAVPYPSHITVSGFVGNVGKVTAQLKNVTHGHSDDIDVLLVGPNTANNLVLVSDAPSTVTAAVNNVTVTFDDAAASMLASNAAWGAPSSSVTAKPTDYDPGAAVDAFPSPAPAPSANTTLAASFNGINPNGQWSLYVVDDGLADAGSIGGGWCLTFTAADTTPPTVTIGQAGGQSDPTSTSPINFTATFSEAVTGFTGTDISFTGSTAPGTLVANVTGGPAGYNVAVSGMTGSGLVVVSIPAGSVTDLAGNPNVGSSSTDNAVLFKSLQSLPGVVTGSLNWKLRSSLTTGPPTTTFTYGTTPLVPIMGDWDGNGTKTAGTFEAGTFKLNNANDNSGADLTFAFGDQRGYPVVGDWNGDGVDDVAVFRAGNWETRLTGPGTTGSFSFGPALNWPTVVPVAGDWNGDGVDGIGVYNLLGGGTIGQWNLRQTASAGPADVTFTFGGSGQYPVTGDWNADGTDGVGSKATAGTTWSLRNTASAGAPDITFDYGAANDLPVVWRN